MAKLRVAVPVLENLVFGFADKPVRIVSVQFDRDREQLILEISGEDVPDAPEVTAICNEKRNNAGQQFTTMSFKRAGEP